MNLAQYRRKTILAMARGNEVITKKQVVEALGRTYYCNADKYLGEVLSRMVLAGVLKRIKPGCFSIGTKIACLEKDQQMTLFG